MATKKFSEALADGSVTIKSSQLSNDAGFATTSEIPTKTSELTNDAGFLTDVGNWEKLVEGEDFEFVSSISTTAKAFHCFYNNEIKMIFGTIAFSTFSEMAYVSSTNICNFLKEKFSPKATIYIQNNAFKDSTRNIGSNICELTISGMTINITNWYSGCYGTRASFFFACS